MAKRDRGGSGKETVGRRSKRRHITDDVEKRDRVLERVFYSGGQPSFEAPGRVGKELGLSYEAVTAFIRKAIEEDEVIVILKRLSEQRQLVRLQEAVLRRFAPSGLRTVLLVPGDMEILADLELARRRALRTEIMQLMAIRVATYLDQQITEAVARHRAIRAAGEKPDDFIIGTAWGRMLYLIGQALQSTPRRCYLSDLLVVPLVPPTAAARQDPVEANLVAMTIAREYGGKSGQLLCPAFVTGEEAKFLRAMPVVRSMLATIRRVDIAITGLGPIPANPSPNEIRVSNDPNTNKRILDEALKTPAIGDICGVLFGPDGREVKTSIEVIGLGLDGLREIASDPERQVVLVTGGDKDRFEPMRVALDAGLASVLVTDTVTARYLVGDLDVELPRRAG